jgi:hypothetical protein
MHEYGLRKRRIEEKPCDFTQDVIACDNMQKLIPCHIDVYCIHLVKQAHAFILLVA